MGRDWIVFFKMILDFVDEFAFERANFLIEDWDVETWRITVPV
jgi:hypothetical protein